jgi:hypothetical protein
MIKNREVVSDLVKAGVSHMVTNRMHGASSVAFSTPVVFQMGIWVCMYITQPNQTYNSGSERDFQGLLIYL